MSELRRCTLLNKSWNHVLATKYVGDLPNQGTSVFDLPKLLSPTYLEPTLSHAADTLPAGRKKLIHPVGTVAIMRFVPHAGANTASGLLSEEQFVLARFSIADPSPSKPFAPGFALKFFAEDGAKFPGPATRNVVSAVSLEGFSGPKEFFRHALTTHVPKPTALPYEMVNHQAQETVNNVCPNAGRNSLHYPLDNLCNVDTKGKAVGSRATPEWIEFWPTGEARQKFFDDDAQDEDFRTKLGKFEKGTHVWRVWGAPTGGKTAHLPIGDLLIEEPPIACRYGDEELFFQHQYKAIES